MGLEFKPISAENKKVLHEKLIEKYKQFMNDKTKNKKDINVGCTIECKIIKETSERIDAEYTLISEEW